MIADDTDRRFREAFHQSLQGSEVGAKLKTAALERKMAAWTEGLTNLVVEICRELDWTCCAKWNANPALPAGRHEYLTLDVTAFATARKGWQLPVAALELENDASKARIAYCLWKLLSVSVGFRCLFCYREKPTQTADLLTYLREQLVASLTAAERDAVRGQTLVCVGTRSDAENFPFGFFRWWRLNLNTCSFEVL